MPTRLKTSVVDVTPKLAALWLKSAKSNRPVSDAKVESYVRQIQSGNWELTGEGAIVFNGDGALLNGQHRLRAVIKANKPIKTLVVRGVETKAMDVMDTGRVRDVRDTLALAGHTNISFAKASAARWAFNLTKYPRQNERQYGSNREIHEFFEAATGLENSVKFGYLAKSVIRSEAIGTALHYLMGKKDRELADQFFLSLGEGTGLTKDSTVYHLRERLLKNAMMKTKLSRKDVVAMIIKTWNLLRQGKHEATRQSITWTSKGPAGEDFPVIK